MQHGKHNLGNSLRKMRRNMFQQSVIASFVVFSLLLPTPAHAVQMGTLKQNSGFKVVILAIANLNFAMKQAAENPMDGWRRQNVSHAMSVLPPAIVLLAKEFKKGNLHDKDFPFVQSILGGFVDKSFVGKMQNFSKNPTQEDIPSLGSNFPKDALQQAEKSYIRMDENREGSGPSIAAEDADPKDDGISSAQLASLDSLESVFGKSLKGSEPKGKASKATLRMNEGAESGASSLDSNSSEGSANESAKESDAAWDPKAAKAQKKFREDISNEIDSVEEKLSQSTLVKPAAVDANDKADDEGFFKEKKKSVIGEKGLRGKKTKKRPIGDKTSFLNRERKHPVAFVLQAVLGTVQQALAVEPSKEGAPGPAAPQQNSNVGPGNGQQPGGGQPGKCGDCGGGGPGGGGQGGGGDQSAQMLMGLAMMMAAMAPMAAAAISAKADKQIAQINSQTQLQLATMTAQSAKYMADNQKALAEFQAKTTEAIADKKNEKDLTVLRDQLASMKYAQDQQRESEKEKRALEDKYNEQRIVLAQRQADDNLIVAKQTLSAQLTQAGLSTGFKNTRDPAGRLDVNRLGGSSLVASTGFSGNSSAASSVGSTLSGGGANATSGAGGLGSQLGVMGGGSGVQGLGFTSAARGRLVASATLTMSDSKVLDPKTGAWLSQPGSRGVKAITGLRIPGSVNRGFSNGTATIAQGSTRGFRQTAARVGSGDVNSFLALNTSEENSFTAYRNFKRRAAVPGTPGSAHSPLSTGVRVYNARGIRQVSPAYSGEGGSGHGLSLGSVRLR